METIESKDGMSLGWYVLCFLADVRFKLFLAFAFISVAYCCVNVACVIQHCMIPVSISRYRFFLFCFVYFKPNYLIAE